MQARLVVMTELNLIRLPLICTPPFMMLQPVLPVIRFPAGSNLMKAPGATEEVPRRKLTLHSFPARLGCADVPLTNNANVNVNKPNILDLISLVRSFSNDLDSRSCLII